MAIYKGEFLEMMSPDEAERVLTEVEGLTDRGSAVYASAHLEQELDKILRAFFINKKGVADHLLTKGPLGSFYARNEAAYALGLISKEERDNIHLIRDIRNKFAHELLDTKVSFQTPEIKGKCMQLGHGRRIKDPRQRFMLALKYLLFQLAAHRSLTHHQKSPPTATDETIEKGIEAARRWHEEEGGDDG